LQKLQTLERNISHHFIRVQSIGKTDDTLMNLQQPQGTWAMNKRNSGMPNTIQTIIIWKTLIPVSAGMSHTSNCILIMHALKWTMTCTLIH